MLVHDEHRAGRSRVGEPAPFRAYMTKAARTIPASLHRRGKLVRWATPLGHILMLADDPGLF